MSIDCALDSAAACATVNEVLSRHDDFLADLAPIETAAENKLQAIVDSHEAAVTAYEAVVFNVTVPVVTWADPDVEMSVDDFASAFGPAPEIPAYSTALLDQVAYDAAFQRERDNALATTSAELRQAEYRSAERGLGTTSGRSTMLLAEAQTRGQKGTADAARSQSMKEADHRRDDAQFLLRSAIDVFVADSQAVGARLNAETQRYSSSLEQARLRVTSAEGQARTEVQSAELQLKKEEARVTFETQRIGPLIDASRIAAAQLAQYYTALINAYMSAVDLGVSGSGSLRATYQPGIET